MNATLYISTLAIHPPGEIAYKILASKERPYKMNLFTLKDFSWRMFVHIEQYFSAICFLFAAAGCFKLVKKQNTGIEKLVQEIQCQFG